MTTELVQTGLPDSILAALKSIELPKGLGASFDPRPGSHLVDFTLHVKGTVSIGSPSERKATVSVPWRDIALLALSKVNQATADGIVRDAVQASKDGVPIPVSSDISERAQAAAEEIVGALPPIRARGAIKSTLFVNVLSGHED